MRAEGMEETGPGPSTLFGAAQRSWGVRKVFHAI